MWKTITNKTSKTTNITEINQSGKRITDDHTIANTLNEYFSEVDLNSTCCQSISKFGITRVVFSTLQISFSNSKRHYTRGF
jgi:hypothetical protein